MKKEVKVALAVIGIASAVLAAVFGVKKIKKDKK